MGGIRKRRDDQLLGMRYSVGFLFGAFLLVPYVAILYPAHLASIFDWQALEIFEGAFQLDSQGSVRLPPAVFRDDRDHSRLHRSPGAAWRIY